MGSLFLLALGTLGGFGLCTDLRTLRTVFRAAAAPAIHPERVEGTTDNMIAHTRQVFHAATANEHDRVLLEVVSLARDVSDHFLPVCQTHLGDFAQRGVRLLRRASHHLHAHATALRTIRERR